MRARILTTLVILHAFGMTPPALAESPFRPILPIEKTSLRTLPLLQVVLRDPKIDIKIKDKDDAADALEKAKDADEDFPKADPADKQRLAFEAMRYHAALAYYLEDVDLGLAKGGAPIKLGAMREKVMEYARAIVENSRDAALKDRARYHYLAAAYLGGKEKQVATMLAKKNVVPTDGPYANKFEFLGALIALGEANPTQGIGRMSKVSEAMDAPAPLVGVLATARALAGFDLLGKKAGEAAPSYGSFLYKAATLIDGYKGEVKDRVLGYMVTLWMQTEVDRINWTKAPFAVPSVEKFPQFDAINERKAYQLFAAGQVEEALEIFARILPEYEESPELGRLTDRRLHMMNAVAQKTGNYDAYAQVLYRADRDFRAANVMGADAKDAAKKFSKRFHNVFQLFTLRALKAANNANAKPEERAGAVKTGMLFLGLAEEAKEKVRVLNEIGAIHFLGKDYEKAVDTFLDIAKLSKPEQKPGYVAKAIEAQSMLARWPQTPPWDQELPGDEGPRKKLITLYQMLQQQKKKGSDWRVLAHIGLLQRANGSIQQAFKLWLPHLNDGSSDGNAQKAAGLMLVHYNGQKDWKDLKETAQAVRKAKVPPMHQGKALDVNVYLADGLYYSGDIDLKKRDYKGALASYQLFRLLYESDKRFPEVLYKSGLTYVELKEMKKFTSVMRAVVSKYPSSPFAKDALKKGIELAKDESDRVYFIEAALKQNPNDPNAFALREQLAKLYVGLAMAPKAVSVYEDVEKDRNAKPEQKILANMRIIDLAEKSKNPGAALAAAERLIKAPRPPQMALAKAYAFNVKYYVRQKQMNKVDEYTALAEKITTRDKESAAALAEIRYVAAARSVSKLPPAPDPKVITDPTKEMQTQAIGLQEYKGKIDRVCELGTTDACVLAKKDLSDVAQKVYGNIQMINLVQGETEKQFKDFENRKKMLLQAVALSIQKTH